MKQILLLSLLLLRFSPSVLAVGDSMAPLTAPVPDPSVPVAQAFAFTSNLASYNDAYLKARKVVENDSRNGKFIAGKGWPQVWTRDSSFSTDLALSLLETKLCLTTLIGLKQQVPGIGECWEQDFCGHFGGWPNLTDSIVGAVGAWSLYNVTEDKAALRIFYKRTVNSLKRAERDAYQPDTGLMGGCSSFMESNSAYPKKYAMNGPLVAKTAALSNCALYYRGYIIAGLMADQLGGDGSPFRVKAKALKDAINKRFWQEDKGYYGYFVDENRKLYPAMEGLGEALTILYGIAGPERAQRVLRSTPTTPNGFPCQWPQLPEYKDYTARRSFLYHNGMIWPFVQGYWAKAAVQLGDLKIFGDELGKIRKLSEKTDTFKEFYFPEDGKPDGSSDQLWSASGYLSMVLSGLMGMHLEESGIRFAPLVPSEFSTLSMTGINYRHCVLAVQIQGSGKKISSFKLDGTVLEKPFFDASLTGPHQIEILLKD
jgi:GH15 family glucan-1,4-alpha-glucosidase